MPRFTSNLHFEAELVLAVGRAADGPVPISSALGYISGVGVGCDLTRRDLQNEAKEKVRGCEGLTAEERSEDFTNTALTLRTNPPLRLASLVAEAAVGRLKGLRRFCACGRAG